MTTKLKIILGFGIMNALILGLGLFGYHNVDRASFGFSEYRRHVTMSETATGMAAAVSDIMLGFTRFLDSRDPKWIDGALKEVDQLAKRCEEGRQRTRMEDRRRFLEDMARRIAQMRGLLTEARHAVTDLLSVYEQRMRPACGSIHEHFGSLSHAAQATGNVELMAQMNALWQDMARYVASLGRFYGTMRLADIQEAGERLGPMAKALDRMRSLLSDDAGGRDFQAILDGLEALRGATSSVEEETRRKDQTLERTFAAAGDMERDLDAFSAEVDKLSGAVTEEIIQGNDRAKTIVLGSVAGGLAAGSAFTLLIILGFVRVISDLTRLSQAITEGDFSYTTRITEKGEIGTINASMRRIPEVLGTIMASANDFARSVRNGNLSMRMDASALPGEYAKLSASVNTVGDAYVEILNQFPPIMACNADGAIIFLNRAAQEAIGGDFRGHKCHDHMRMPQCGTAQCLGRQSMARGSFLQETQVSPQGNTSDVAVNALPIINAEGEKVGFYECLTDISVTKRQQRTMEEVTRRAMGIANRMAAAAEELSAQVEQVSRGAEVQRARVEATASAMTEMNSTVLEVAGNASKASEQSELSRDKANEGATLVNRVVASIHDVNSVARQMQTNMAELGRQAEAIGGVMGVISDIADQTNLLALNAAIEAARAGEAGRGFAVVADEVRKLAEKTMTATQEVGGSIGAIQQTARANVEAMGNAVKGVDEATQLANQSGSALGEIVGMASDNSSVVASIATAAEEQSATSEEISRALEEINRIVGDTTEGMLQSSTAVQELSRMAQELNTVMEALK